MVRFKDYSQEKGNKMLLFLLSPAKTLDEVTKVPVEGHEEPHFLHKSLELIEILKTKSPPDIESLMKVSEKLAVLNAERFSNFSVPLTHQNAKEALFLFNGDAYSALSPYTLSHKDIEYVQSHLMIISGLYGLLKPLDLIAPYRLEMGTPLINSAGKNLYEFWGTLLTEYLNTIIKNKNVTAVVNLASNEYYSALQPNKLSVPVITPVFKDFKNGQYKTISFNAKKARGLMVRYAAQHDLSDAQALKDFTENGYYFKNINPSKPSEWLFYKD